MTNPSGKRILSIDRYRGIAVFLLVVTLPLYFIDAFDYTDPFTTHIVEDAFCLVPGYTFYDLIAPVFIFAAGLSFGLSYSKNVSRHGVFAAIKKTVYRALRLIAVGTMLMYFGESLVDMTYKVATYLISGLACFWLILAILRQDFKKIIGRVLDISLIILGLAALIIGVSETIYLLVNNELLMDHWNVLQSIGFATLITILFHSLRLTYRIGALIVAFLIYALVYQMVGYNVFAAMNHGGVLGSFGWGILMALADLVGELAITDRKKFWIAGIALAIGGIIGYLLFECYKYSVSPGYVSMSFTLSLLLYMVVMIFDFWRFADGPIVSIGRNAILFYIIYSLASAYVGVYLNYYAYVYGSEWIAYLGMVLYMTIIFLLGFILNRHRFFLKV